MSAESSAIATLNSRNPHRGHFVLNEQALIFEWNGIFSKGRSSYYLEELSPDFGYIYGISDNGKRALISGFILLGLWLWFYFAQVNGIVAQLSFILSGAGVLCLAYAVRCFQTHEWTIVQRKDGSRATFIAYSDYDTEERKAFESALTAAVLKRQATLGGRLSTPKQSA